MPLPAAWHPMPDVGAARDQGPGAAARAHPQIGRVLRRGQSAYRQVRPLPVREVRCGHVRELSEELLRHRSRGKRMVIVLDNARYHHAMLLKPLLRKYRTVLSLLFLPPYSPQLAPIERVWKLARRMATHNRFFATLGELLTAVDNASTVGAHRMQCYGDYAALFKTLCLETLRRCVEPIAAKPPSSADQLAQNPDPQDIIALNLQRAVQLSVDLASPPDRRNSRSSTLHNGGELRCP